MWNALAIHCFSSPHFIRAACRTFDDEQQWGRVIYVWLEIVNIIDRLRYPELSMIIIWGASRIPIMETCVFFDSFRAPQAR